LGIYSAVGFRHGRGFSALDDILLVTVRRPPVAQIFWLVYQTLSYFLQKLTHVKEDILTALQAAVEENCREAYILNMGGIIARVV
jgi:hypothetical protein